ncbi:DNA adenine methylase [Pannus brasiliensis CCIBt3594]|uniref:site-specific DNA-methyltransferase (adenine-specific) n=1 Tax=Pannus brasiliensis CCIBt3594 TaxID=1427578 RepID=A0AAW9QZ15_9CHRO
MSISPPKTAPKPFLKWAGGKAQLIPDILALIEARSVGWREFTYIEPFVGAGAILFAVLDRFPNLSKVVINDVNPVLVDAYKIIKSDPENLIEALEGIQEKYYRLLDLESQKEFFFETRDRFNALDPSDKLPKTALFLFLNKTCFNGLYRVNRQGLFNVPFGKYKRPTICNRENLIAVHRHLQKVEILQGDFSQTLSRAEGNTIFYFDPPYKPIKVTSAFTAYVKENFDDKEQMRLKEFCDRVHESGHFFIVSNSDVTNFDPSDRFFDELYQDYTIKRVKARRNINSKADERGEIFELLISNF